VTWRKDECLQIDEARDQRCGEGGRAFHIVPLEELLLGRSLHRRKKWSLTVARRTSRQGTGERDGGIARARCEGGKTARARCEGGKAAMALGGGGSDGVGRGRWATLDIVRETTK
jgi:hypothetical protein